MLNAILAPMSTDEFFHEHWTKKFVHIPGPADKFRHLFPWEVLNRALEQHRFLPTRLRLVRAAYKVPPERYLVDDRVDAAGLSQELAAGATLIVVACEEMHPPLRDLCVYLERLFHVRVIANLYAGWRTDHGFDVHWDDQDTMILQVSGRKHWKIWKPTRRYPFMDDVVDTSSKTKPDEAPIWDGVLEQGSMLSIPRGWWHVAYPMDEPCLHLTVTVANLNGINFLQWLVHQMKASEAARMELPIVADEAARRAWLGAVWQDLSAAWTSDLLDQYLADVDDKAKARPSLDLPELGGPIGAPIRRDTPLQLALSRPLRFRTVNGTTHFSAAGVDWQTPSDLRPALERFNDGLAHTISEVSAGDDQRVQAIVTALTLKGILRPVA